jgi:hypothetical protein
MTAATSTAPATEIIGQALQLPLIDRSYLAKKLILSLEEEELSDAEIAEYDRRTARLLSGEDRSYSKEEFFNESRKI